jgi:putative flippase GtrA
MGAPRALWQRAELLLNLWNRVLPFRFLIVGTWNFVFSYFVFALVCWMLRPFVHDALIFVISSIIGITGAFVTHRLLTYRSRGSVWVEYFRFYVVYGVQVGLNFVLFLLFVRVLARNPYVTQAVLATILTIVSYWGHKNFSFSASQSALSASER